MENLTEDIKINIMNNNDYIISKINPICNDNIPCYHNITIMNVKNNNYIDYYANGLHIAEIFNSKNESIPQHFIQYFNNKN
jgi:hypothetical protein